MSERFTFTEAGGVITINHKLFLRADVEEWLRKGWVALPHSWSSEGYAHSWPEGYGYIDVHNRLLYCDLRGIPEANVCKTCWEGIPQPRIMLRDVPDPQTVREETAREIARQAGYCPACYLAIPPPPKYRSIDD